MVSREMSRSESTSVNPPKTDGLNSLDMDRAASVANEGGASAATTEHQRPPLLPAKKAARVEGGRK